MSIFHLLFNITWIINKLTIKRVTNFVVQLQKIPLSDQKSILYKK